MLAGSIFYAIIAFLTIALLHWFVLSAVAFYTGLPRSAVPSSLNFPAWELFAVLAGWSPLCISATMAMARVLSDITEVQFTH